MSSLLDAAHGYAKRGWRVLPLWWLREDGACACPDTACAPGGVRERYMGKHPHGPSVPRGVSEASGDPDLLRQWFLVDAPEANIGVALDGLLVVDVDPRNGGDRSLAALGYRLPPTMHADTGGGGQHFVYRAPAGPVLKRAPLGPGIDIKTGAGSYIIVAPSVHRTGGLYRWTDLRDPAEVTGDLLVALQPPRAVVLAAPKQVSLTGAEAERATKVYEGQLRRIRADFAAMRNAAVPDMTAYRGPGWNQGTYDLACWLVRLANAAWSPLSLADAHQLLMAEAPRDPGFTDADVDGCWRSATRTVGSEASILPAPRYPEVREFIPRASPARPQNGSGSAQEATATVTDLATRERPVEAVVEASLPRSDDGNALLLVERFGDRIRYCPERGAWLAWAADEARWDWCEAGGGVIREYGKRVARSLPSTGDGAVAHKTRSLGAGGTSAMLLQASTDSRVVVRLADLDADPYALNTPGGVVDLRTGLLAPSDAAGMHTRSTSVAPDFAMPTPRWDTFLADTFAGHEELTGYVQRLAGYSATGLVIHHVLPFAYGAGQNGKSIALDVLRAVLGTYGGTVPAGFLMARTNPAHETEIARLSGLRFVICSEVNQTDKFDEARVKLLTGGDPIAARFMRADYFEFEPTHHLWLMGNHQPKVGSGGDSFWRRLRMIPFANRVPDEKKIDGLDRLLIEEEGPGILAWIIRGAAEALRSRLATPPSVMAATEVYAREEDALARFAADCLHFGGGHHVKIDTALVRRAYEDWCRGEGDLPLQATPFGRELRTRYGVESIRSNGRRFYLGVTLVRDETDLSLPSGAVTAEADPRGDRLWNDRD